eukprot:5808961-Prymnesium_polylepis.1
MPYRGRHAQQVPNRAPIYSCSQYTPHARRYRGTGTVTANTTLGSLACVRGTDLLVTEVGGTSHAA